MILRPLAPVLATLAAIGWAGCVAVSLATLIGYPPVDAVSIGLFIGNFPLWMFAVIMATALTKNTTQNDFWRAAFRGCPPLVRYMIWGSWAYSFAMFFLGAARNNEIGLMAGFAGVFYASALGISLTANSVGNEPSVCTNGHEIGPFAHFCSECGARRREARS